MSPRNCEMNITPCKSSDTTVFQGVEAQQCWHLTDRCRTLGRRLNALWSLVLLMVCVNITNAQPGELEHFQFVKAITLSDPDSVYPEPLLITQIRSLDVAADGRMLVVDWTTQAFLFGPDGKLLAVLDPSVCHPGFEVRPVNAKFIGNQSIFLSNAGPWGYRFTSEGGCLGSVDPDFIMVVNPNALDTDAQGGLVSFDRYPDKQVVRRMDASGKLLQEYTLPASDYTKATNRIAMGGLIADKTHHFYAGPVEPHILKLTPDGEVVDRIAHRTSWFRDVTQDLSDPGNLGGIIRASGRLRASSTLVSGLFELTDQFIMIQYTNGDRGQGYQIFTKAGQLVAQELGIRVHFQYGASGLVYRVVRPESDAWDDLSNHIIEVYQFITP